MKFIVNTIFIVFLSLFFYNTFFSSYLMYASTEENNLENKKKIIDKLHSFIKEKYSYPSDKDLSKILGIDSDKIENVFGSFDDFYESLLNSDTEGKILKIILESDSSLDCYQDEVFRSVLQKGFIKHYIYPWIEKNKRFLSRNFTVSEEINIYDGRIFNKKEQKGLFDSLYDLIQKSINYDTEEIYLKYIFASDLYEILCNDKDIKEKLQKVFIKDCLFFWMEKKIESSKDKNIELIVENITIFSRNLWGVLFDSKLELINQIMKYDTEQKYVKYILKFKYSARECYNLDIRTILQKIFIVHYLFPWMKAHQGLPDISEFAEGSNNINISYYKIFGNKYNAGIFDSFADLMRVFIKIDEKEDYLKNILNYDFPKDCYEDLYVRGVLQTLFVKYYLCPWIDKNQKLPVLADFSEAGIGLEYSKIFYTKDGLKMFYSIPDVIKKLEDVDVDGKYKKYTEEFKCISIFSKSKKKKNQEDDL